MHKDTQTEAVRTSGVSQTLLQRLDQGLLVTQCALCCGQLSIDAACGLHPLLGLGSPGLHQHRNTRTGPAAPASKQHNKDLHMARAAPCQTVTNPQGTGMGRHTHLQIALGGQ